MNFFRGSEMLPMKFEPLRGNPTTSRETERDREEDGEREKRESRRRRERGRGRGRAREGGPLRRPRTRDSGQTGRQAGDSASTSPSPSKGLLRFHPLVLYLLLCLGVSWVVLVDSTRGGGGADSSPTRCCPGKAKPRCARGQRRIASLSVSVRHARRVIERAAESGQPLLRIDPSHRKGGGRVSSGPLRYRCRRHALA